MGIIPVSLESLTPEEQRDLLERVQGLPSTHDIAVITSETAVPLKLTWRWIVSICSIVITLSGVMVGSVWWLANDRAAFQREQVTLRADLIDLAESLKDSITTTISQTDSVWQLRFQKTMAEVNAARAASDATVRQTFLQLESRIPKEFPPERWLDSVYQRDIEDLKKRIDAIEKALRMKSASSKTAQTDSLKSVLKSSPPASPCF